MAINYEPIYSGIPKIGWSAPAITAANTAKDGTGTVTTCFVADSTYGSFVQSILFSALGSNVATVARIFINNGLTNATPANNTLFREVSLPLTVLSEVAGQAPQGINFNFAIPPGYKINVVLGTAIAAGVAVIVSGGDFTKAI